MRIKIPDLSQYSKMIGNGLGGGPQMPDIGTEMIPLRTTADGSQYRVLTC